MIRLFVGLVALSTALTSAFAADPVEIGIGYHQPRRAEADPVAGRAARREQRRCRCSAGDRGQQHYRQIPEPAFYAWRRCGSRPGEDASKAAAALADRSIAFIIADLPADALLQGGRRRARRAELLFFNAGATDDRLREEDCRANVIHVAPTRSMLADALAAISRLEAVAALAARRRLASRRQALRRRAAPRRHAVRRQDRRGAGVRGYRRRAAHRQRRRPDPAPDAGVHAAGARPTMCWSRQTKARCSRPTCRTGPGTRGRSRARPASCRKAGTPPTINGARHSCRTGFMKRIQRRMTALDMQAWTAARMIGEAAARMQLRRSARRCSISSRARILPSRHSRVRSLRLRDWNLQLRQPILLADGRMIVSVSPQEGFLHQVSELDTLGYDRPETKCKLQ